MIGQKYMPSAHLRNIIAYFWTWRTAEPDETGGEYRLIPDGYVDWVFHLREPWTFTLSNKNKNKKKFRSHIFGHTKSYIDVVLPKGGLDVFGIKFQPWAAHYIWGVDMNETTGLEVSLDELVGGAYSFFEEKMLGAESVFERVRIAELFLENKIKKNQKRNIMPLSGTISLINQEECLSRKVSGRRIQQRFKNEIGISPKLFQRTLRVNKVIQEIIKTPHVHLTSLAYQYGYFDQSHFIHEFKQFTSMSPSRFISSINPSEDIFNLRIG